VAEHHRERHRQEPRIQVKKATFCIQ
jgi:hypothetical protein